VARDGCARSNRWQMKDRIRVTVGLGGHAVVLPLALVREPRALEPRR
jgi:hypothetical protein